MRSYQLPDLDYLKLRFHLIAQVDCTLPSWKGSLIRGAFGHALRRTVCTMKHGQECKECMLRSQCAYTRLFETFVTKPPPPFLKGLPDAPRPFIFEPMDDNKSYNAGDILWFDLILIGDIVQYLPYVVFAIYQMGKTGLGRNRYPFELNQAFCLQPNEKDEQCWKLIYDGESERILFKPDALTLSDNEADDTPDSIKLNFQSQTRFIINNGLTMDFTFRMLVFKILRRTLELAHFYTPKQDIEWEFHDFLVSADDVNITQRNLRWLDKGRYSNRQRTKMKMGGFVGDIVLNGSVKEFSNLLKYAEVVHVGKGSTFGLGKVEISK